MNLSILGPQGSGKGTQARLLSEKFGLFYFEMGDFLRDLAKKDAAINQIMNVEGKLVPDDMFFFAMKGLLEEKILKNKGIILDGFPRTIDQYKILKSWFSEIGVRIDKIIFIDISEKESIRRLSNRRTCKTCGKIWNLITLPKPPNENSCECGGELFQREDDQPEKITRRLEEYHQNTKPLLEILEKEGILVKVDGERSIEVIQTDLERLVKNIHGQT